VDVKTGQSLLVPKLEYDFWDTTLPARFTPIEVIDLYQDHGTHEQFHSEFKTDLDLERLPSGKFATNDLILSLAALAYNVLRLMGQSALLSEDAPVRHTAKRRRLMTVMQELIDVSAKLVAHARRKVLVAIARPLWCSSGCIGSGRRRSRLEAAATRASASAEGNARLAGLFWVGKTVYLVGATA